MTEDRDAAPRFEEAATVADLTAAASVLTELLKAKTLSSISDDPKFKAGIDRLLELCVIGEDPLRRLSALAIIGRALSVRSRLVEWVPRRIAIVLEKPLPPLSLLADADQRKYVAEACSHSTAAWLLPWLQNAVVTEETGENGRAEMVRQLLVLHGDLASVFGGLAAALAEWHPETKDPAGSAARRTKRILTALRRQISLSDKDAGPDLGERYRSMVVAALRHGIPDDRKLRIEVAGEVAGLLYDLVRTQFSIVDESETYLVLNAINRWFPGKVWPHELEAALEPIARTLVSAIALLAKQGITDFGMIERLSLVRGSRDRARADLRRIAEKTPGIAPATREWLAAGGIAERRQVLESAEESALSGADQRIAKLLVDSEKLTEMLAVLKSDLLPAIEMLQPKYAPALNALALRSQAMVEGARGLARSRSLHLKGQPGERVEFDPNAHAIGRAGGPSSRQVRIIEPAVERRREDIATEVVRKAIVEST